MDEANCFRGDGGQVGSGGPGLVSKSRRSRRGSWSLLQCRIGGVWLLQRGRPRRGWEDPQFKTEVFVAGTEKRLMFPTKNQGIAQNILRLTPMQAKFPELKRFARTWSVCPRISCFRLDSRGFQPKIRGRSTPSCPVVPHSFVERGRPHHVTPFGATSSTTVSAGTKHGAAKK